MDQNLDEYSGGNKHKYDILLSSANRWLQLQAF
jgi:hypothetical protein